MPEINGVDYIATARSNDLTVFETTNAIPMDRSSVTLRVRQMQTDRYKAVVRFRIPQTAVVDGELKEVKTAYVELTLTCDDDSLETEREEVLDQMVAAIANGGAFRNNLVKLLPSL